MMEEMSHSSYLVGSFPLAAAVLYFSQRCGKQIPTFGLPLKRNAFGAALTLTNFLPVFISLIAAGKKIK